ncbi:tyrosine-type recombinase/integrase [Streptomyces sp. So13.3]|uniref:tyrosine-type recombinase/integrase n=1 Tax=Streptomyces sp. So13.3 TaxID=2136173 RepID=UPI0011057549|nr:tyrosine-type recombinase/integrase [Streptomyces sp. So13.3]QNA71999.1 tyrosine-type recombinase/integrase [Streptomyces sp. So13.3]
MYSLISRLWHAARRAAGIVREITPHWLRHFFASAGLAKGVSVTDMAEWLGHRDPRTTHRTYAHVMPDAPERLRTVMDSTFNLEAEVILPLEFEAVHEAAFAVRYRGSSWDASVLRPLASGGAGSALLERLKMGRFGTLRDRSSPAIGLGGKRRGAVQPAPPRPPRSRCWFRADCDGPDHGNPQVLALFG